MPTLRKTVVTAVEDGMEEKEVSLFGWAVEEVL
jgi:hypothetical protein